MEFALKLMNMSLLQRMVFKMVRPGILLQSQDLRVNQEKKSCIRFIQENLIENLVQDYLPYILKAHGLYPTTLAYPK